jgi:short-subunit dehydrogenase
VVLAARSVTALEELAQELRAQGGRALTVPTDVRDVDQLTRLVNVTLQVFGRIDVLVNNAGQGLAVWAHELTPAQVEDLFRVNTLSAINLTRLVLPGMMARRQGMIINVSSVAGKVGVPSDTVYAATKFAMNGFAQGLRAEVAAFDIKVLTVCPFFTSGTGFGQNVPGHTRPPRNPLRRMTAREVAEQTVAAAAAGRHELVLSRPARVGVLLSQFAPGLVDWTLARVAGVMRRGRGGVGG